METSTVVSLEHVT